MKDNEILLIQKAIDIALKAHAGQRDKAGELYLFHPIRVMLAGKTIEEKIVGILHDVVEDTNVSIEDLKEVGFSETVIIAIDTLSKRKDETYDAFIDRVCKNKLACSVKILDLKDNMNPDRIENPTQEDFMRMSKYKKALTKLINQKIINESAT